MRWAYGCTDLFEKAAVCRGAEFFHRRPGRNTAGALYQRHPLYFGRALFFTARGKEFCRELLHDGQVQILAYTRYKEMIRVSAKAVPVPEAEQKRCIDLIFQEQPYLSNVYPGATREIGIVFVVRDMRIEYFHLGVKPISGRRIRLERENTRQKVTRLPGSASAAGNAFRSVRSNALHREHPITSHRSTACIAEIASSSVPYRPSRKNLRCSMNGKEKQRLRRGGKAETMLRARTRTEKDVFRKRNG